MRVEGSDGLAGGWLFAHLRVAPSPQTGNPIVFEPALLINYAESCLRAICGGHRGDPRGRPLRANPSTRPSRQPARRAWVAAPASGHEGRLCGGAEAGGRAAGRDETPNTKGETKTSFVSSQGGRGV